MKKNPIEINLIYSEEKIKVIFEKIKNNKIDVLRSNYVL